MQALIGLFERHGKIVQVAADDAIFTRGSEISQLYRLQSGRVMLHSSSLAGREIGFEILGPQDLLGILPNVQARTAGIDATALSDCELLAIDRQVLVEALLSDVAVCNEILQIVATRLMRRTKQAEELALYAVRGRLARYVIALADQQNDGKPATKARLVFSQKIMAAMAGVSRETLNRQFRSWSQAGIIAIDGKDLQILKPDRLNAFAGAAYD
jgi:CRP/FNR family transcriptional regulator, cyclic AMP receptor protein